MSVTDQSIHIQPDISSIINHPNTEQNLVDINPIDPVIIHYNYRITPFEGDFIATPSYKPSSVNLKLLSNSSNKVIFPSSDYTGNKSCPAPVIVSLAVPLTDNHRSQFLNGKSCKILLLLCIVLLLCVFIILLSELLSSANNKN